MYIINCVRRDGRKTDERAIKIKKSNPSIVKIGKYTEVRFMPDKL